MSLLSETELQQLRSDILPLLSGTVVVTRPTNTSDGQGGYTRQWAAVGTVNGRVEPYNRFGAEETGGDHPDARKIFFVITPAGTDIKPVDRITCSAVSYEVMGVRSPRTDEVTCRSECLMLGVGGTVTLGGTA